MPIKVESLQTAHPDADWKLPRVRAAALGDSAFEYLRAWALAMDERPRLFSFLLPAMHQVFELISKAIAFMIDPAFDPKKYSHHVHRLMRDYSPRVPTFAGMMADHATIELLDGLESSYLGVRYGECYFEFDNEAVRLFMTRVEELMDDFHARTGLGRLPKHLKSSPSFPGAPAASRRTRR